jgi:molybdenum cofactor cytidylyltransferase
MAVTAASNVRSACDRAVAVVRADDVELATLLAVAGCEIIRCTEADAGMGHSLATAVRATADAAGWIVALADMPFITTSTHRAVTNGLRAGASLIATQYRGQRGHPVGFCGEWFRQLTTMTGDEGGKTILENYRNKLELCSVDDPGVINDIDRPEDLLISLL